MSSTTIIYWRDIPTQIISGRGRKAIKYQLTDRFMVAVDRAAMVAGKADTESYLSYWRKAPHALKDIDMQSAIDELASEFETAYPTSRLAELARNGGYEPEK